MQTDLTAVSYRLLSIYIHLFKGSTCRYVLKLFVRSLLDCKPWYNNLQSGTQFLEKVEFFIYSSVHISCWFCLSLLQPAVFTFDHARNQNYVAQKFYRAQRHPIIFITLVSSHQILKNESYYTFNRLVLSHYRLKNEIYYIHYLLRIWAT